MKAAKVAAAARAAAATAIVAAAAALFVVASQAPAQTMMLPPPPPPSGNPGISPPFATTTQAPGPGGGSPGVLPQMPRPQPRPNPLAAPNTPPPHPTATASTIFDAAAMGQGGPIYYSSADFLVWKVRGGTMPATVLTVPVGLINVNNVNTYVDTDLALIGAPAAVENFGNPSFAQTSITNQVSFQTGTLIDYDAQCGLRLTGGFWLDEDRSYGLEISGFMLTPGKDEFSAVVPVSNSAFAFNTGLTNSLILVTPAVPGGALGSPTPTTLDTLQTVPVVVTRESASVLTGEACTWLFGVEASARSVFMRIGSIDIGALAGPRYLFYMEKLEITDAIRLTRPNTLPLGNGDQSTTLSQDLTYITQDSMKIKNHFIGGQIGFDADAKFGAFFLNARVKGGVGLMLQGAKIDSTTTLINNDPLRPTPLSRQFAGGLLSSAVDNGHHHRSRYGFLGEANIKLGYQFTSWLRGYVGYDGLYMGHVARTGISTVLNNVNTNVNIGTSTQTVNVAQPTFHFRDQDVWVQGLNFGLEAQY